MTHLNFKPGSIKAARNFSAAENGSLMQSLQDAQVAQEPASTIAMLVRSEKQNFDLVGHTVSWILRAKSVGGAILVFTSGVSLSVRARTILASLRIYMRRWPK